DGAAWMTGLRDQRQLRTRQLREDLERVHVRVRTEQPHPGVAADLREALLECGVFRDPRLAAAGREDAHELRRTRARLDEDLLNPLLVDHQHRQVDLAWDVG